MISAPSRLRRALHLRSLLLVRRIIESNPHLPDLIRNFDAADHNNTSLHLAAQLGLQDIAEYLIDAGHEDDGISRNLEGVTPLMVACQAGLGSGGDDVRTGARVAVGVLLVGRFPESVGIRDKSGMDAFHHAARHGTNEILTCLLSLPLSVPAPSGSGASSPALSFSTSTATITASTAFPAPSTHPLLTTRTALGDTPLHHASAFGHLKTVRLLISAGADATARNKRKWTPLDYSASVAADVYLRSICRERDAAARKRRSAMLEGDEVWKPGVRLVKSEEGEGGDDYYEDGDEGSDGEGSGDERAVLASTGRAGVAF